MPELPEVTTTVNGLKKTIKGLSISSAWTDLDNKKNIKHFNNTIKDKNFFKKFKKEVEGSRVIDIQRRGKNILIKLSTNKIILIHLKMTGHIMVGKYNYDKKNNKWNPNPKERKSLHDSFNKYLHFVLTLSNGKQMVLSDVRKFGKVTLIDNNENIHLKDIGPEPLEEIFSFENFKDRILLKRNKNIKTVLMDQSIIAGIGNIYSDEMLWLAGIHPESKPGKIPENLMKLLYKSMKEVLKKGIDLGGDSMSDYRNIYGEKGNFQTKHNVYRLNKKPCGKKNCKGVIMRKVIDGRGAHFCNTHQKLFN